MTHARDYEQRVVRYADGEMNSTEQETFEAHLDECKTCSALLEDHRESLCTVRAAFANPPESELFTPERVAKGVKRRRRRAGLAMASGLVILAATVFATVRTERDGAPLIANDSIETDVETEILALRIALLEAQLAEIRAELDRDIARAELVDRMAYYEFASIAVTAAQHLEESGLDFEGAREQYQFVAEHYTDAPAAATARRRLLALGAVNTSTT